MASRWEPFAEIAWRPNNCDPAADAGWFTPAVDIVEDEESFVLDVELPGMRPEEVSVSFDDHVLTIRGERKIETAEGEAYHRRERSHGAFCRAFALPDEVDSAEAVAVMAEGVLTLRVPKREPQSASPSSLDPLRRAS
ncbi:MAG: Heat shock protein Hsp20 family [Myxococcaceae bacterium]|nr:Heat shock protein Hsp20 family [Myxococcaceae bacterium]